jgi:hypothetical protein
MPLDNVVGEPQRDIVHHVHHGLPRCLVPHGVEVLEQRAIDHRRIWRRSGANLSSLIALWISAKGAPVCASRYAIDPIAIAGLRHHGTAPTTRSSLAATRRICSGMARPLRHSSNTVRASAAKRDSDAVTLTSRFYRMLMRDEAMVERCAKWQSDGDFPL